MAGIPKTIDMFETMVNELTENGRAIIFTWRDTLPELGPVCRVTSITETPEEGDPGYDGNEDYPLMTHVYNHGWAENHTPWLALCGLYVLHKQGRLGYSPSWFGRGDYSAMDKEQAKELREREEAVARILRLNPELQVHEAWQMVDKPPNDEEVAME